MKVYAIIGGSQQTIIPDTMMYQPVENEILMVSERPDGNYIAKADGTWEDYIPPGELTLDERVEILEADNESMNDLLLGVIDIIDAM